MLSEVYNVHTMFLNKVTLKTYLQYDRKSTETTLFSNLTDENGCQIYINYSIYNVPLCFLCYLQQNELFANLLLKLFN